MEFRGLSVTIMLILLLLLWLFTTIVVVMEIVDEVDKSIQGGNWKNNKLNMGYHFP